jgi:2-polyprenyl-3-methyl-5-hydroxy-6-metoxy-1,4-benzoquinol methylase
MYKKPSRKEIEKYYSDYYPKMMSLWERNSPDPRAFLIRKLGVSRLSGKAILDIGCGTGKTMERLGLIKRNDVYGIDISRDFVRMSRKRGIIASAWDIERRGNLPYEKDFFDAIFMLDLIEHIFYPKSLLKKCRRILRPEGKIYATLPNWLTEDKKDNIQKIYETSLQKIYKGRIPDGAKRYADFNFITIHELRKILASLGFRISEIHGFKWRWKELGANERRLLWSKEPLKARDLLLVIERVI